MKTTWCVAACLGGAWLIFADGLTYKEACGLLPLVRSAVEGCAPCVMDGAPENQWDG